MPWPARWHRSPPSPIPITAVTAGLAELPAWQHLRKLTGAVHAAAWISRDGHILALREDVGRHNALDKLLGHLAGSEPSGGFVLVSSRASYEMVQKVAMLGIGCLVAVSAPTALAVRLTTDAASPWPASPVERGWWSTPGGAGAGGQPENLTALTASYSNEREPQQPDNPGNLRPHTARPHPGRHSPRPPTH
jgi:hypothetical protein